MPIATLNLNMQHTKRSEEPSVLSRCVSLLKSLLDSLLSILPLRNLLESVCGDSSLQPFQLERVTCGHQVVVVDNLDEWLDFATLGLSGLRHTAGDLRGVTLNTGDDCVRVWVGLVSGILGLDNHDLCSFRQHSLFCCFSKSPSRPVISVSFLPYSDIRPEGSGTVIIYLLSGISASSDDRNSSDLEDCNRRSQHFRVIGISLSCVMRLHFILPVVNVEVERCVSEASTTALIDFFSSNSCVVAKRGLHHVLRSGAL